MKQGRSFLAFVLSLFFVCLGILLQTGCEEATGLSGLSITPSSVTLSTNNQQVVFSVSDTEIDDELALPLAWSVSDGSLGSILFSSGTSATYQRTDANGVNTLVVRDQYDNEGYATINQTAAMYSITLESDATDNTINIGGSTTISISSDNSQAPYSWSKRSGPGTLTGSSGSESAVFTSSTTGTAVIQVTDANGASGVIGITVEDSTVSTGGDDGSGGE
jgi:hypothetical protein